MTTEDKPRTTEQRNTTHVCSRSCGWMGTGDQTRTRFDNPSVYCCPLCGATTNVVQEPEEPAPDDDPQVHCRLRCGWVGKVSEALLGKAPGDALTCPRCKTDSVGWGTPDLKGTALKDARDAATVAKGLHNMTAAEIGEAILNTPLAPGTQGRPSGPVPAEDPAIKALEGAVKGLATLLDAHTDQISGLAEKTQQVRYGAIEADRQLLKAIEALQRDFKSSVEGRIIGVVVPVGEVDPSELDKPAPSPLTDFFRSHSVGSGSDTPPAPEREAPRPATLRCTSQSGPYFCEWSGIAADAKGTDQGPACPWCGNLLRLD